MSPTEWTSFSIYMSIDPREPTLTIKVYHSDNGWFLNKTWKIESIPYKFILPKDVAFSTSNDMYLEHHQHSVQECANAFDPPRFVESPGLRVCSREDPCQHYGGDCGSVGDESCVDDLGTI